MRRVPLGGSLLNITNFVGEMDVLALDPSPVASGVVLQRAPTLAPVGAPSAPDRRGPRVSSSRSTGSTNAIESVSLRRRRNFPHLDEHLLTLVAAVALEQAGDSARVLIGLSRR